MVTKLEERSRVLPAGRPSRLSASWGFVVRRPLVTVAVVAAAVRLVAVVAFTLRVHGVVIPDERQYIDLARWMSEGKPASAYALGYGQSLVSYMPAFIRPLVWLFWAFGPGRLPSSVYVAAFGVATAVLTTVLARRVLQPPLALAAGLAVAVVPSQVLFSSVILREALIWASVVTAAVGVATVLDAATARRLLGGLAVLCAGLVMIGWLRDQTLLVAVWALPVVSILGVSRFRWWRFAGSIVLVVVIPMIGGIGPGGRTLLATMIPQLGTVRTNLSMNAESAFTATTLIPRTATSTTIRPGGGGAGGEETTSTTTAVSTTTTTLAPNHDIVVGYEGEQYVVDEGAGASFRAAPRGLIAMLLRPFPGEGTSMSMKLAGAEDIVWYPLYLLAAVGAWAAFRRRLRAVAYPVLVGLGLVATSAVTQGNLGTAFRHRGQILWLVALLAAIGVDWLVDRRRARRRVAS